MPDRSSASAVNVPRTPDWFWPLALAAPLAWTLRPLGYAATLGALGEAVRDFDMHGYGLMGDLLAHVAGLPVLLLLLWWLGRRWRGGVVPAATAGASWRSGLSWVVLALVGTPSFAGWLALRDLPLVQSWPVALTSALWLLVALRLRAAWAGPALRGEQGSTSA